MSTSEAKPTLAPGAGMARSGRIKIGELARKTGKTPRALHLYEEMGLLVPSARTEGGFRLYGPDEVARVYWITKLQDIGFSLPQIQSLLATVAASQTAPEAMNSVRELFRGKLDDTRAQVARLLQLERDLSESLAYLEGCRLCQEPAKPDACNTCISERRSDGPTPSLVVGIHRNPGPRPGNGEAARPAGAELSEPPAPESAPRPDPAARPAGAELSESLEPPAPESAPRPDPAARPVDGRPEFTARPAERPASPTDA